MTKSQVKISKEMAEAEVKTMLEAHYIDCDFEDMEEEEAEQMQALIGQIARPIKAGRAVVDGKKYTLTILEPQGDLTEVSFEKLTFHALTYQDRAKNGESVKGVGHTVAAMFGITYAEICKMPVQDFNVMCAFQKIFMSA